MLPDQNNFSFCLHIFCFISFHNCRGECCCLALVATSYKMQHPKGKKKRSILFLLKNWSQIFRGREINQVCQAVNPCRHMQPQPHSAYMGNPAKAGLLVAGCCLLLFICPFIPLPLYSSSLFLFTELKCSSEELWGLILTLWPPVTGLYIVRGLKRVMDTNYYSWWPWCTEAGQKKSLRGSLHLQSSPCRKDTPQHTMTSIAQSLDSSEALCMSFMKERSHQLGPLQVCLFWCFHR